MTAASWLEPVLTAHLATTLAACGLIWFVQVVHYPLFAKVPVDGFAAFHARHVQRTGWIVIPLMLLEAGAALGLLWLDDRVLLTRVGFALLAVAWLSTALLQVPCHERLRQGFDASVVQRLVGTNWIRTVAWTARGGVALALT
ncbi:MAG: hypothetical protein AAF533_29355 [Acidobacteriota bacterium]